MTTQRRRQIGFLLALAGAATGLCGQETRLTTGQRAHLDAGISPDGKWVAYEGNGTLYVQPITGGPETMVINIGGVLTYFWEAQSSSFLVFGAEKVTQVSRDGLTRRNIATLTGQDVLDFFFLAPGALYLYGIRRVATGTNVIRVRLTDGKLEDLITTIPGITSLDLDPSGKKILITATIYLFQYAFYHADLDGSNVTPVNVQALGALTAHGRWLDAGLNFLFEHVGTVNNVSGGYQVWSMDAKTAASVPVTWKPRQRRGVPELSPDRRWLATLEYQPATGEGRVLLLPSAGGGELRVAGPYFAMSDRVRWSPDGLSLVYVGADKFNDRPDVRVFKLGNNLRLSPTARPAGTSQVELALASNELGAVFLGLGLSATPLRVPPLTGSFDLDLTLPVILLYTGGGQDLKAPFIVPNDTNLVGVSVLLQSLRLLAGPSLRGAILPPIWVDIAP